MRVDRRALDGVGIKLDIPVTLNISEISLRSALNLMLEDSGLSWTIKDEVLLITSLERAENQLVTEVYDVADLIVVVNADGKPTDIDFDPIIELITSTIDVTTWDEVGGPGSIKAFLGGNRGALVVAQSDRVQQQIQKLLADLRKLRDVGKPLPNGLPQKLPKPPPAPLGPPTDNGFGSHVF